MTSPSFYYSPQHCKPAVDEEKFKGMVERQYEIMRRERQRQLEEPKAAVPASSNESDNAAQSTNSSGSAAPDATVPATAIDSQQHSEVNTVMLRL